MNKYRVAMQCKTCGSNDVRRDAWAVWNVATQQWELGEVFDHEHCQTCEGETTITKIPVGDEQ